MTVDLATAVGVLVLANPDKLALDDDLREVRAMEKSGLFVLKSNDLWRSASNGEERLSFDSTASTEGNESPSSETELSSSENAPRTHEALLSMN